MSIAISDAQRASLWSHIQKSDNKADSVTYPQLLGAARLGRLSNNQYQAAALQLLGLDAETFRKAHYKRNTGGIVIQYLRVVREIPPEALVPFDKDPGEPPEERSDIRPSPPLTAAALRPQAAAPPRVERDAVDDLDWDRMTASTTSTAGAEARIRQLDELAREMAGLMAGAQGGEPAPAGAAQAYGGIAKIAEQVASCRRAILKGHAVWDAQDAELKAQAAVIRGLHAENDLIKAVLRQMSVNIGEIRGAVVSAGWL